MSLVIYLGLGAFTREPNLLLPPGQSPLPLQALQDKEQQGIVLLDELTDSAVQLISHQLAHYTEQHIQLLWPQPVPYMAARAGQATPGELQKTWKAQAQRLVALFRKHRKQLKFYGYVPGQALTQTGGALTQLPTLEVSSLHRLAAAHLVNADAELQQAHAYLVASSQETSAWQQNSVKDINDALAQQRLLEDAELENHQYAKQLDQAQQTLEQQLQELNEARKAAEEGKQTAQALNKANAENGEAIRELHKVQEALEKALNEKTEQAQQSKQIEEENTLVTKELHRVQEALEKSLNEKNQQAQQAKLVEEENTLVIKELHRVQEAFEQVLIEKEQRLAQLHKVQEELERLHIDKQALEKRAESRQKNLNVLRSDSEQRIKHLEILVHWLRVHAYRHASAAYRNSRAYKKALPKQVALVESSAYFNAQWYCKQYPDVAKSGMNPAEHFVKFGALEGRNPSATFATEYYLTQHQDVAASGQHPLLHYVKYGMAEQRDTQPAQRQLPAPQQKANATKEQTA